MGHEDSIVATFFACGLVVVFLIHFLQGLQSGKSILNEGIELFTYEPEAAPVVKATVQARPPRQSSKPKRKNKTQPNRNAARPATQQAQQQKVQRNHNGYTELQQDCFDSLKSLGIKAVRERQFIISNTFNKHDIKTVQDFLKVALHRGV